MATALETGEALPPGSVEIAVSVCAPGVSAEVGVKVQLPDPSVVAVPTDVPSTRTVTVLLASAVPEMVGRLVVCELFEGEAMTGATGGVVSMAKVLVFDAPETLPAASVEVAETVCEPAASGDEGVKVQFPEPSVVAVPTGEPSIRTVTVLLASAVPLMAGVVLLVALASAGAVTTGAAGAVVSMVKVLVFEETETLPAASVATTDTV